MRSESIKDRFGLIDGTSLANISEKRKINKNNSSGHKGVHYDKQRKKWVAQITFQRKNHNLGRFNTLEEAVEARKKAEELYFEPYRNKE
ncbi:AP2 domain-containing protein [Thomasclavelia ramosa]|nr:AP2 domain-containing protein [Thomasclavelia ramosa]